MSPPTPSGRPAAADAFERHVVPELDLLYRTARRLSRSTSEAEDLVQETLLRAFRSIDRFDGRHPKAWLLTIMRNANINRARKRTADLLDDPDQSFERDERFADVTTPESAVVDPMFQAVVEEALAGLDQPFAEVIHLVDLGGRSYAEAASELGVPVGTIMSRLHRGRRRIRQVLLDAGIDGPGVFAAEPEDGA